MTLNELERPVAINTHYFVKWQPRESTVWQCIVCGDDACSLGEW